MNISDDETRIGPQDNPVMRSLVQDDRLGDYRDLNILGRRAMGAVQDILTRHILHKKYQRPPILNLNNHRKV